MDIFAKGTLLNVRFASPRGLLTMEDLFKLPRDAETKISLVELADELDNKLSRTPSRSRKTRTTKAQDLLILKLAILDYIIEYKDELEDSKSKEAAVIARKQQLAEAIEAKKSSNDASKSLEELEAELKSLT